MTEHFYRLKTPNLPQGQYGLATIGDLGPEDLRELNDEEKKELDSFTHLKRQREYLTSRLVLKRLAGQMNLDRERFVVLKDKLGCPYGRYLSDHYYISIAHSNEEVFCGVSSRQPIGLDLEPVSRRVPGKLMRRILHPKEAGLVEKMLPIRLWTIKEALVKLEGRGLRMNMNEVMVRQEGEEYYAELSKNKTAKICSFESQENWLAVAFYL